MEIRFRAKIWERVALPILLIAFSAMGTVPLLFDDGGRNIAGFESLVRAAVDSFESRLPVEWDSADTIRIAVAFSRDEFERKTHGAIPDWGIGAANPDRQEIVLLISDRSSSPKSIELVTHELGHIFLHNAVGDVAIPRWFDEGFAQWVSGTMDFRQSSRLAVAVILGRTIPLSSLGDVNSWDADRAELAYAESRAAFNFLMRMSPNGSPVALIRSIAEAGDFEDGFSNATGMTIYRFYRMWSIESAREYNYTLLLADWRIMFSLLTLLFVVLGAIKLVRNKLAKSRAEDEED